MLFSSSVSGEPGCGDGGPGHAGVPAGGGEDPAGLHHGHQRPRPEGGRLPPPDRDEEEARPRHLRQAQAHRQPPPGLQDGAREPGQDR